MKTESMSKDQGPVVQRIVSLTSSLGGQLIMCFCNFITNTDIFVEKMGEAFALAVQKLLTIFSTKNICIFQISTFEILTKC